MYPKGVPRLSDFHIYVLVLIGLTTLVSIILALSKKKHLTNMTGMIISMFLGMNVGLTAGVTFGIVYQGNLFLSTITGMVIGILAGFLCGICFGILSSLEGLMSGLMGGMMGAMLGEMLAVEQANVFIKIFLLLTICTVLLLIILTTPNKDTVKSSGWFLKPILTSFLICTVLFLGNSLNTEKEFSKSLSHNHEQQDTHNTVSETQKDTQEVVIETSEMSYLPQEVVVEKDMLITFELKNSDQIEHDIEIRGVSFSMVSESSHHHGGGENVLHLHAEPQKTSEMTLSMNEVGTYEFYCTIPGHKENGMVGKLVVK